MEIQIDNKLYPIEIIRKPKLKNIYIRVKKDLVIYISVNRFLSDKQVMDIVNKNKKTIIRMIERKKQEIKKDDKQKLYYLGMEYDIVYINRNNILFSDDRVYIPYNFGLDKWYHKEALPIFKKELDRIYSIFPYKIPYPSLTIRSMKTRWGVCNTKLKRITLNLKLIKLDKKFLEYVIVHELSHLIEANHSKDFWKIVEQCLPDYKKVRKELRDE